VLLVVDTILPRERQRAGLAVDSILAATGWRSSPSWGSHHGRAAPDGGRRFGAFFKVLFLISAAITILLSKHYLEVEDARPGEYYFLILCATLGMMVMAAGIDLVTLFIGLETMTVPSTC